jgi:hypothetical protein
MTTVRPHAEFASGKPDASPGSIRVRVLSILIAAPALLVPIIVVIDMFWARHAFYEGNAKAFATGSPTISRAISEPAIAQKFAVTISVAAVMLALVCWRIIVLYDSTIAATFRHDLHRRVIARSLLVLVAIMEACSIIGMVSLSWLTERSLHIGSSYLFFFGQALAILCSGLICLMLRFARELDDANGSLENRLSPNLSKWRSRAAPAIAAAALVFWCLFLIRDTYAQVPYWLDRTFSSLELVLIVSFLFYLATFSPELYRSQLAWRRDDAGGKR